MGDTETAAQKNLSSLLESTTKTILQAAGVVLSIGPSAEEAPVSEIDEESVGDCVIY